VKFTVDGGAIIANSNQAVRLDTTGAIAQQYPLSGAIELFALNLDPDGKTFWTADILTGQIWRVDIATGAVVTTFNNGGEVSGLQVVGEQLAAVPTTVNCAVFRTEVEIKTKVSKKKIENEAELEGICTLGPGGVAFNPANDAVSFTIGSFSTTIPKGSFKAKPTGGFAFEGAIGGVKVEASIGTSVLPNTFNFEFEADVADPTGGQNPVPVAITVGNNAGAGKSKVEFKKD
jgi:hypothetical protein